MRPRLEAAMHDLRAWRLLVLDLHDRRGGGRAGGARLGSTGRGEGEGCRDSDHHDGGQGKNQFESSSYVHGWTPCHLPGRTERSRHKARRLTAPRLLANRAARYCARREASEGVMWSGPPVLPRFLGEQGSAGARVRPVTVQDSAQDAESRLEACAVRAAGARDYVWRPLARRSTGRRAVLARSGDPDLPWQRVVRADGSLPKGERQRKLLDAEGVPFKGQRVDMKAAWTPT